MSDDRQVQVGRLALREEGKWWVAYYAMPDTMKGAILLAKIKMRAVELNPEVKELFMECMRELVGAILEERVGKRPDWHTEPAPEHERSGKA